MINEILYRAHQLYHANRFPGPGVRREVSAHDCTMLSLNSSIQSAFAINGPTSNYFNQVPFTFVGKSLCKSLGSISLSWVEFKCFLETLGGSSRIRWLCKFGVVYAERRVRRSICPVVLQGINEMGESFFTKVDCARGKKN